MYMLPLVDLMFTRRRKRTCVVLVYLLCWLYSVAIVQGIGVSLDG